MSTNIKSFSKRLFLAFALILAVFSIGSSTTYALGTDDVSSESVDKLVTEIRDEISNNVYYTPEGDGIRGRNIFGSDGQVTDEFDKLKESEKNQFLKDIDAVAKKSRDRDTEAVNNGSTKTNVITDGTLSAFWQKVSDKNSVASRMIVVSTQDYRADFNSASIFLAPFSPYFNTGSAVLIILASFGFFLFLAMDLLFFTTTPLQWYVENGGGGQGGSAMAHKVVSSLVSFRATSALKEATSNGGNPLLKYFAKSWGHMLAYALVLLFFAGNSMLILVGPIVNLFASLLGF